MSRLSSRNLDFMTCTSRASTISSTYKPTRKSKPQSITIKTSKPTPPSLHMNFDSLTTYYNAKEGKFNTPFTGSIQIPRGTFQLSAPTTIKLGESSSLPVMPKVKDNYLDIIEEIKSMVPSTPRVRKNMKLCLRSSIRQLKILRLNPQELIMVNKLIPQLPYGRANSRNFFQACKDGNLLEVETMLTNDKYLAHVFDPMKMTALHWVCLRGYLDICKLLLASMAFVDAVDISHRTPLHIASKNGFSNIVEELLKNGADPTIVTSGKKTPLKLGKDDVTKEIIKKFLREKYITAFNF
ncbi:hypothetical protein SteCoe_13203 [Stentor coeruleus]|uniref:Uncharacterized protein n=1 Tax=Stentor coeruleus TaxID=5963 RepID=A0A1R2C909_9CILI|nr:hypothetical protein SteCoe_13203 [Stentor coeruleus]